MHWRDARWLMLGVFVVGFVICQEVLGTLGPRFLVLTLLDGAACAVLLSRLSGPLRTTLWAWIGLVLLLDGYFLRMYWFVYHINQPNYINQYYLEDRWVTTNRIIAAYPWVTAGFVTFCIVSAGMLSFGHGLPTSAAERPRTLSTSRWSQLAIGLFLLYLLTSLLQYRTGFGVRGFAAPSLPLHLGTLILLLRQNIIPGLLLLALWVFDRTNPGWARTTVGIIFACALIDTVISASRGDLLTLAAPVFVLWMLTGRFSYHRKLALGGVLLATLILLPIISNYRTQRLTGSSASTGGQISIERLVQASLFLGDRVGDGGIDSVWFGLDHKGKPSITRSLMYLRPTKLDSYYTFDIVGVSNPNDHRNAGMFGAFIIIGSGTALFALTVGVVLMLWALWTGLRRLRSWPVALALMSVNVTVIVADPTNFLVVVPKLLIQVLVGEIVYRKFAPLVRSPQQRSMVHEGEQVVTSERTGEAFRPVSTTIVVT